MRDILLEAMTEAKKSTMKIATHGALVILRNKIIARGHNKYSVSLSPSTYSIHAEVAAINNALMKVKRQDLRQAKLVVIRLTKEGCLSNSFPCKNCQDYINKFNIKRVYYSSETISN